MVCANSGMDGCLWILPLVLREATASKEHTLRRPLRNTKLVMLQRSYCCWKQLLDMHGLLPLCSGRMPGCMPGWLSSRVTNTPQLKIRMAVLWCTSGQMLHGSVGCSLDLQVSQAAVLGPWWTTVDISTQTQQTCLAWACWYWWLYHVPR